MQKKNINLLQQRGAPLTFWEKFYDWITNTARVIVIVTELLVLGAFGWRFWLDRKLNDLKSEIKVKGETLKSLSRQEDEIRDLQAKTETYNNLWDNSSYLYSVLREVNGYLVSDISDLNLSMRRNAEGSVLSVSGILPRDEIDNLENDLKDSSSFSEVKLSSIEKQEQDSDIYDFTINALVIDNNRYKLTNDEGTESTT